VTFTDGEDVFQEVELETTSDLLSLLRWPMTQGGPMYTDYGVYVTWNVFDSIEYEDMEFIRPYVIFRATKASPDEFPPRISQFFDDAEELTVEIAHDESVCPIALGEDVEHGPCWRISYPTNTPKKLKQQFRRNYTGRDLHGLLVSGRIWAGSLYEIEISFSHIAGSPDCLVFQEDKWIRMLLRGHGVSLPSTPPGSFLRAEEEKWDIEIEIGGNKVYWRAESTLTGRLFSPYIESFDLENSNNLEEERTRILDNISKYIGVSFDKINNIEYVEEYITDNLTAKGFGEDGVPCWLLIEHSTSKLTINVKVGTGIDERTVKTVTYQIDDDISREAFGETIYWEFEDGWLSGYNITNKEESDKQLHAALNRMKFAHSSDDEYD
jgi:hypothetical protein